MEDYTGAQTPEASVVREKETYPIMTMNMNGKSQGAGSADNRRELIKSTLKDYPASVIFCQELPGKFEKEVFPDFRDSYEFVRPEDCYSGQAKVAVMWCNTDFQDREVDLTDSSLFTEIVKTLIKEGKLDIGVFMASIRSAMVKLTSRRTEASFLAVSWYWPEAPEDVDVAAASKAFYDLICFVREVCEDEKLFWFIIGGDLIFHTSKVHLTEVEGVTISCGPSIVPIKDIFVFSVPSVNKLPKTVDITLSEEKPLKLKNESKENPKLKHVPVVRVLNLVQGKDTSFTEDTTSKSYTSDKTLTPETTAGAAELDSRASRAQRELKFGDGKCVFVICILIEKKL